MPDEAKFTLPGARRIVRGIRRLEAMPRPAIVVPPPMVSSGTPTNWRPGKNLAEETIPALSCVRTFTGAVINGVKHHYAYKPSTTFYKTYALTPNVDCASGGLLGLCFEVGFVKYDGSGTPVAGEMWGPKPGQFTISKGFPGCEIIDVVESGIALVRLVPLHLLIGKTTGAVTGGTGTTTSYRIYYGAPFNGSDAGFTTVDPAYSKVNISTDKWIEISIRNGYPLLQPLECN